MRSFSKASLVFVLAAVFCGTGCSDFFVSGNTVDHITLTPISVFLKVTETKQFAASAVNVDGTQNDISSSATWNVGSTTIATTNNTGLITAVAPGTTTVVASQGGVNGTGNVVVGAQSLNTTIAITPNNPSIAANQTTQLTATGVLGDNSTTNLTNFVLWTSDNTTNVSVNATGVVTGLVSGQTAHITATIATATGAATGTVTVTVQ